MELKLVTNTSRNAVIELYSGHSLYEAEIFAGFAPVHHNDTNNRNLPKNYSRPFAGNNTKKPNDRVHSLSHRSHYISLEAPVSFSG